MRKGLLRKIGEFISHPHWKLERFRKIYSKAALVLLATVFIQEADAQVTQSWQVALTDINGYSNGNNTQNKQFGNDATGAVYVAGQKYNSTVSGIILKKYSKDGALLWSKSYEKTVNNLTTYYDPVAIHTDATGNTTMLLNCNTYTSSFAFSNTYVTLVRFDTAGEQVWDLQYGASNLSAGGNYGINGLAVDKDGNAYVSGTNYNYSNSGNYTFLLKFDATGTFKWRQNVNSSSTTSQIYAPYIKLDSSGNIYTVDNEYVSGAQKYTIRKYSADGATLWAKAHLTPAGYASVNVASFHVDTDGNSYMTGNNYNNNNYDLFVAKYSTTGDMSWNKTYEEGTGSYEQGRRLTVDVSGNVYVIGTVSQSGQAAITMKYNSDGVFQWGTKTNSTTSNDYSNYLELTDIAVGKTGNVYIIGSNMYYSHSENSTDKLIKYDASGMEKWRFDIAGTNYHDIIMEMPNNEIILDASENVYVKSGSSHSNDIQISKYTQIFTAAITTTKTDPTNSATIPLSIEFDRDVTGFAVDDFTVTNGTIEELSGSGKTYTANLIPTTDGAVELELPAASVVDENQFANGKSTFSILYDKTAPAKPADFAAASSSEKNTLTWTANTETDLVDYKVYGGVSGEPQVLIATILPGTNTYAHSNLVNGSLYKYTITASDKAGNISEEANISSTPKDVQTITFNTLAAKTYGDADFTPEAVSSANLEVSFSSSNTDVATIVDGKVRIVGAGTAEISASQGGNTAYNAAPVKKQTLTVAKKSVSPSLKGIVTKTYDGSKTATLTAENYGLSGVLTNDELGLVNTSATFSTANAGKNVSVTAGGLSLNGASAANYTLSSATASGNIGEIKPKELTAGLTGEVVKTYDATTEATLAGNNYSLPGVMGTDNVVLNNPVKGSFADTQSGTGKLVTVEGLTISGTSAGNYVLTATSVSANLGTINKKSVLASLTGHVTKTYDGSAEASLSAENYILTGVLNNETVTLNNPAKGQFADKNTGTQKTVEVSGLEISGTDASNYTLTLTAIHANIGEIKGKKLKAVLTGNVEKTFDGTQAAALSQSNYLLEGVLNEEQVALNNPSAGSFADKNQGSGKSVTVSGLALTGTDAANYTLENTIAEAAIGKINRKSVTVALTAAPAIGKVYDGTTASSFQPANYVLSGVLTGDKVSVSGKAIYNSKDAGETKIITGSDFSLSGTDKDNYLLTTSTATVTGKITQKQLTVTALNATRYQGEENPAFKVSYDGFVAGEDEAVLSVKPTASAVATATSMYADYVITVGGGSSQNYAFNYLDGTLTVKPSAPTGVSLAASTVYENLPAGAIAGTLSSTSLDPGATFTYTLVNGSSSKDNGYFSIDGNTIKTASSLNFESKASYTVLVRSTTQYGLYLDKAIIININDVNEQPTLADVADQTICYTTAGQKLSLNGISAGPDAGQNTILSVSSTNSALFKSLNLSQASNGSAQLSYEVASSATGSAVVTILVQDDGGTANDGVNMVAKSFTITVNALPVISISSNIGTTLSKGQIAELTAASTGTYQWASASGIISGQTSATLTVRPEETTTYTVTVTNANGCSSQQHITIVVNADYEVVKGTNIISPNGDGVNDRFIIKNIDMYPKNEVKIFDRAGRLLYSQQNYTDQWDGTLNGSPLAEDTYYYVVDFGPTIPRIKGFITIVKD